MDGKKEEKGVTKEKEEERDDERREAERVTRKEDGWDENG